MRYCTSVSEKPKRIRYFGFMDGGAVLDDSQFTTSSYFLINNGPTPVQKKPKTIPSLNLDKVAEV